MVGLRHDDLLTCFVALAVILVAARAFGTLAHTLRQPEVVGELVAGFVLGPSVLGALSPAVHARLFLQPGVAAALSAFSWIGAVLLLLIAGMEVDLRILRREARAGASVAAGSIVLPVVGGAAFAAVALRAPLRNAVFLGVVISVTAVTVAARVLIERETLRRRYAQVILAAGIVSEVLVWPVISVMAAAGRRSPAAVATEMVVLAAGFFVLTGTVGRQLVFQAMRWVNDTAGIVKGQTSLVLVMLLLAAAATMRIGLHPLLGAFVLGIVLRQAPRTDRPLLDSIQTLTTGLFAPVFFALAGMRVDMRQLRSPASWLLVLALFLVATAAKWAGAAAGARVGGLRGWEAALVGAGVDAKGGTDVIVAIIGVDLGLLSPAAYTMYTVVAVATVPLMPLAFAFLEPRVPPSREETERLQQEHAAQRGYARQIERVLVPVAPAVIPVFAAEMVERIAVAKRCQSEVFDVTELVIDGAERGRERARVADAMRRVRESGRAARVQVTERHARPSGLRTLADAAKGHQLIAIGAAAHKRFGTVSFGRIQDSVVRAATNDVLLVVGAPPEEHVRGRILAPVNGLEYSTAAADLAAHVAVAADAELVLFHVASANVDALFWSERDHARIRADAMSLLDEVQSRTARLGVRTIKRVRIGTSVPREILAELRREPYQLVALGGFDRGTAGRRPALGPTIDAVVCEQRAAAFVLVSRQSSRQAPL